VLTHLRRDRRKPTGMRKTLRTQGRRAMVGGGFTRSALRREGVKRSEWNRYGSTGSGAVSQSEIDDATEEKRKVRQRESRFSKKNKDQKRKATRPEEGLQGREKNRGKKDGLHCHSSQRLKPGDKYVKKERGSYKVRDPYKGSMNPGGRARSHAGV